MHIIFLQKFFRPVETGRYEMFFVVARFIGHAKNLVLVYGYWA